MKIKKPLYRYEFNILFGFMELQTKHKIILDTESLFKSIERISEFYFKCTIIDCYNVSHNNRVQIVEIKNLKLHDLNGFKYDYIKQLVRNRRLLKK